MYNVKIHESDVCWMPLEMAGVSMKVLHKDEATGAMAVLTRMDAGATIPAHFHTKADETVFVLAGDFVEDGASHGPGAYFVGKAGVPHGPHRTVGGCTVLTHFSAELDFQMVSFTVRLTVSGPSRKRQRRMRKAVADASGSDRTPCSGLPASAAAPRETRRFRVCGSACRAYSGWGKLFVPSGEGLEPRSTQERAGPGIQVGFAAMAGPAARPSGRGSGP